MPKAVIAILKGGLGNQLFIYAAARALALRTGRDFYLDEKRGYAADTYGRNYRLDRFPIQAQIMPESWSIAPYLKHPRHKLIRALNKLLPRNARSYYAERSDLPVSQLLHLQPLRTRITLLGYWQDEGFFADHATAVRAELVPPRPDDVRNQELGRRLAGEESVFGHFRRGRYPNLLASDYYQQAIDRMCARLRKPVFVLFGDDLRWPMDRLDFHGCQIEVVGHNSADELADLWLMTRCRHAVTANSSFSWWGAWLGGAPSDDRLIMAPSEGGVPLKAAKGWQCLPSRLDTALSG